MKKKIIVITPPKDIKDETEIINKLFDMGLNILHLRKPNSTKKENAEYIKKINKKHRNKIVLCQNHSLINKYPLYGLHYNSDKRKKQKPKLNKKFKISTSAHKIDEAKKIINKFDYFFLSPIHNSISKKNYNSRYKTEELLSFFNNNKKGKKLIALGGINENNTQQTLNMGFGGIALFGFLWNDTKNIFSNFRKIKEKTENHISPLISIAGTDPSSGAGMQADIKTAENLKTYCYSICSGITIQSAEKFVSVNWLKTEDIIKQIDIQPYKENIFYVKIGIIENWDSLSEIIKYLKNINPAVRIIWDPVLKSSSGFSFHTNISKEKLEEIMQKLYLITPNYEEALILFGENADNKINLQNYIKDNNLCAILLKGGHKKYNKYSDSLILPNKIIEIYGKKFENYNKHGTGCVLSTAITAELSKGKNIKKACCIAKKYIERIISSNTTNLAWHIKTIN